MEDEPGRVFLTSMVACLFARSAYNDEQLGECLEAAGYQSLAETISETAEYIRKLRWKVGLTAASSPKKSYSAAFL